MRLAILASLLGACGGTHKAPEGTRNANSVTPSATCETAGANVEKLAQISKTSFVEHCKEDERITQEMLDCWSKAPSVDDIEKCPPAPPPRKRAKPAPEQARVVAQKYAFEAYPSWAASHPDLACPTSLADLDEYMNGEGGKDPWGHPYEMSCGADVPAGVKGLGVRSGGPDGKLGSADDIRSWDE